MLLTVENLRTHFDGADGTARAVDGVSLAIPVGRTLALVGESGCGKSLTALSIMRLVPPPGCIVSGSIRLNEHELLQMSEREMRASRGSRIAMIFQEPMTSLNPLLTIGEQIGEALRLHCRQAARAARQRTVELLRRVGMPVAERRCREYPHELSGGMRQRAMIAMALACEPELLIADEPTTALDVTVQARILTLLRGLQRSAGLAMLFISHDLGVVAQIADTVGVMYAGRIVEQAPTAQILSAPKHPYTRGLLRCTPRLTAADHAGDRPGTSAKRLPVIPGEVPSPAALPPGCAFQPRCEFERDDARCRMRQPRLEPVSPGHECACWHVRAVCPADR